MCMEDVRNDRLKSGNASVVSLTGPATAQLIGADELRTALTVSGDGSTTIWIGPEGVTLANLQGYVLNAQEPHATLRLEDWGMLLRGAWNVFCQAGTVHVFVASVRLNKE